MPQFRVRLEGTTDVYAIRYVDADTSDQAKLLAGERLPPGNHLDWKCNGGVTNIMAVVEDEVSSDSAF